MATNITIRCTKAEILSAYTQASEALAAGPTWGQVWIKAQQTWRTVSREAVLLVKDCYLAGCATRRVYDRIEAEVRTDLKRFPFKA